MDLIRNNYVVLERAVHQSPFLLTLLSHLLLLMDVDSDVSLCLLGPFSFLEDRAPDGGVALFE